jgi:MFS family permease
MTTKADRKYAIRFIVAMGIVSLFADMTYEGAHSIIGPYLKDLGASATQVGIIAGFGELIAATLRLVSGKLADKTRAYWTITFIGYALNLTVVPGLAFAQNWQGAALFVVAERTGKGLRGPSKDVLLSGATKVVGHGWGFGLHAAMDQTGAVLGPLFMAAIVARENTFGPAFLWLALPAVVAFTSLFVARTMRPNEPEPPPELAQQRLPGFFWIYVAASGLLACGFVDFALLAYHFQNMQLARPAAIPLYYAVAMGVAGLSALVFGRLFDRYGLRILTVAIAVALFALPLGFLGGPVAVVLSVACWATGLGAQNSILRSGIAQVISMNKRGTAYGAFNAVYGLLWFAGSVVMGILYDYSIPALVAFGIAAQLIAGVMFLMLHGKITRAAKAK